MSRTFLVSLLVFGLLYGLLLALRMRVASHEDRVRDLGESTAGRGGAVA
jgi:hypothetical protein